MGYLEVLFHFQIFEEFCRYLVVTDFYFDCILFREHLEIQSLEIYCEKAPVTVSDLDKINSVKDDMILIDHYESKYTNIDWNLYYDAGVSLKTPDGIQYISVILPKDIAEYLMQ